MSIVTEDAHLVPQEERSWFTSQGMSIYADTRQDIDDRVNILPLRPDFHKYLDRRIFVVITTTMVTTIITTTMMTTIMMTTIMMTTTITTTITTTMMTTTMMTRAILLRIKFHFLLADVPRKIFYAKFNIKSPCYDEKDMSSSDLSDEFGGRGSRATSARSGSKRKQGDTGEGNTRGQDVMSEDEDDDDKMTKIYGTFSLCDAF